MIAKWLAAIQEIAFHNPKPDDALRDRLVKRIAELNAKLCASAICGSTA